VSGFILRVALQAPLRATSICHKVLGIRKVYPHNKA